MASDAIASLPLNPFFPFFLPVDGCHADGDKDGLNIELENDSPLCAALFAPSELDVQTMEQNIAYRSSDWRFLMLALYEASVLALIFLELLPFAFGVILIVLGAAAFVADRRPMEMDMRMSWIWLGVLIAAALIISAGAITLLA